MMRLLLFGLFLVGVCNANEDQNYDWDSLIKKINTEQSLWKAGYNFHPKVHPDSLKILTGAVFDENRDIPVKSDDTYSDIELPDTFDARKNWPDCSSIGHISDQGNCGSCWVLSGVATLTDRFCISSKGKIKTQLSAHNLLSCCNACGYGCDGGDPYFAWLNFKKTGIVSGGDYGSHQGCQPYSLKPCEHHINGSRPVCGPGYTSTPTCHFRCSNGRHSRPYWRDLHKVKDVYRVNRTDSTIMKEIYENGPVQATMTVYEDFLTYKSGVYKHIYGEVVGRHAIKYIGWGIENHTPYWLAVNSWNTDWGDNGLFKIFRGEKNCCCENYVVAGTPDTDFLE